jgi:hypothetical protein
MKISTNSFKVPLSSPFITKMVQEISKKNISTAMDFVTEVHYKSSNPANFQSSQHSFLYL